MKTFLAFLFFILPVLSIEFRRVCYFTNWSRHIKSVEASFHVDDIDTSLCTHLIYAFAKINVEVIRLYPTDSADDNGSLTNKQGTYYDFTNLKKQNPNLKTLLSVGGATLSAQFPNVVSVEKIRKQFAENCRIFLVDRNFDGLDIDWEYPGHLFKNEFTLLLKDLREEFDSYSNKTSTPRLLLTIASAVAKEDIDDSYNIREFFFHGKSITYVDFINVMAYDYTGPFSLLTGFVAPLWSRASNRQVSQLLSQKDKLVLGISGAGASFKTKLDSHGVGVPVIGKGNAGTFRKEEGHLSYYEICSDLLNQGAKTEYDEEQQCPFSYIEDQWVGYDNPRSVKEKVGYAGELGLGGVMFWSLDLDDFTGKFCGNGTYPLLRAMKAASLEYTELSTTSHPASRAAHNELTTTSHPASKSTPTEVTTNSQAASAATPIRTMNPRDMKGCQIHYDRETASLSSYFNATRISLSLMCLLMQL